MLLLLLFLPLLRRRDHYLPGQSTSGKEKKEEKKDGSKKAKKSDLTAGRKEGKRNFCEKGVKKVGAVPLCLVLFICYRLCLTVYL